MRLNVLCIALVLSLLPGGCGSDPDKSGQDTDLEPSENEGSSAGGYIRRDTLWGGDTCPVTVTDDIIIEGADSPVLTIEAGCEVRVRSDVGIGVGADQAGGLIVNGTSDAPVRFTSSSSTSRGAWAGLVFGARTVTSTRLSHAVIEYAGGAQLDAALQLVEATLLLEHVTIRNSDDCGMMIQDGSLAPGSTDLTISGSAMYGICTTASAVGSIPATGSYGINDLGAVLVGSGEIKEDTTWAGLDGAYQLLGSIYVYGVSNPVLTLEAGARLEFADDAYFQFGSSNQGGSLVAKGTAAAPVVITGATKLARSWHGVSIGVDPQGKTNLHHTRIEYGGGGWSRGCLSLEHATALVDDVQLADCGDYGLHVAYEDSRLASGSQGLKVTGASKAAVYADVDAIATLPSTASSYGSDSGIAVEAASSSLDTSGTWPKLDGLYFLPQGLWVQGASAPALTIAAGAHLEFGAGTSLNVGSSSPGALRAAGTPTEHIVFTAQGGTSPGAWGGLYFGSNTVVAQSAISYVEVLYAGGSGNGNAGILTNNANVPISDVTLSHISGCGVRAYCDQATDLLVSGLVCSDNSDADLCAGSSCF